MDKKQGVDGLDDQGDEEDSHLKEDPLQGPFGQGKWRSDGYLRMTGLIVDWRLCPE